MKKAYIKIIAVCLFFVMISALVVVSAAAEGEYIPIKWTMDENGVYLYGNEKRYERYDVNGMFYSDARVKYYFMNSVELDGRFCRIYGDALDPHIVSVEIEDDYSTVFVDAEGRKIIEDFLEARNNVYYLEYADDELYTVIDEDFVIMLDKEYDSTKSGKKITVKASELQNALEYEVTAHDIRETRAYQYGGIYKMSDGNYYYLLYLDLDNSHFDANGMFSYRNGTVEISRLDGNVVNELKAKNHELIPKVYNHIYEEFVVEGIYDENGTYIDYEKPIHNEFNMAFFWIGFVLIGFVVPAVPTVFGLVLPNTKKCSNNKGWYALAGFGLVWILSALGIMLILVL